jgi:hypothetical protein
MPSRDSRHYPLGGEEGKEPGESIDKTSEAAGDGIRAMTFSNKEKKAPEVKAAEDKEEPAAEGPQISFMEMMPYMQEIIDAMQYPPEEFSTNLLQEAVE